MLFRFTSSDEIKTHIAERDVHLLSLYGDSIMKVEAMMWLTQGGLKILVIALMHLVLQKK